MTFEERARGPRVSVVMIFLNAERFMREAIDSVLAQTYEDWELLLVDDGSRDGSTGIARQYVEKYPAKIFYMEHGGHQNLGMSASRNLGIRNSRGHYIAFLDSDDVWLPPKLEQQIKIMEGHPEAAMVCGRTQWWYSWTGRKEDQQRDFLQKLAVPLNRVVAPPSLLLLFLKDWGASLCDILVRRNVVDRVGGYEESFKGMYEDQVFHAKICLGFPVYVSDACWYRYRQHSDSCCSVEVSTGRYPQKKYAFLEWLNSYLSKLKCTNADVWRVVGKELWPYRHPILGRIARQGHRLAAQTLGAI